MSQSRNRQETATGGQTAGYSSTNPVTTLFEVRLANSPALLEKAHRLRYDVYCVEQGLESPDHHPDGLERDEYDGHSVQSVLIHRQSGIVAGVARLILPWHEGQERPLPFHQACARNSKPHPSPLLATAEASRLLISREFVRHANRYMKRRASGADRNTKDYPAHSPVQNLLYGLIASIAQMSAPHDITHICALMRPALRRLLSRLDIHLQCHGPMVDYHGWRQPCLVALDDVSKAVAQSRPDLWEIMFVAGRLWHSSFEARVA
ncbi:MAG: PEP-CTERM/exosortase system-associated acyltransferase [Sphingomonadales bacterium]